MITGWNWYLERRETFPVVQQRLEERGFDAWQEDRAPIDAPGKSYWLLQAGGFTIADFAVSTKTLTKKDKEMALSLAFAKYGVELED